MIEKPSQHTTATDDTPAWMASIQGLRGLVRPYDVSRPVLVAIDLQRLFVDPASPLYLHAWAEACNPAEQLLKAFTRARLPIVFTRHAHTESDSPNLLGHFFDRLLLEGDPLAELAPCTEPHRKAAIIHGKNTHAAFAQHLPDCLEQASAVILIGVQTPLCVMATALDLARYGRVPVVVADACAAADEASHLAALRVLACGHAHVRSCAQVLNDIEIIGDFGEAP